ncbi:MAG: crossover junction endodeoxyribonuclease RuvC, partial [Fimbriimonadaceae bacterium]|nr:crossover junction endodeoxyribonuclease RuvC [Fimbriimonadaceae bacterium]
MTILGIDPGLERVGYGVIQRSGSRLIVVAHGLIQTPRIALPDRLRQIHEQTLGLIDQYKPNCIAT